jgi:hypothetical protein
MKQFFIGCLLLLALGSYGQATADPALNQINITDNAGIDINEFALPLSGIYTLQVPILNLNTTTGLPAGTCKVKIGLGSKLVLDPDFNLANTNTSNFFSWTAVEQGGQVQITGDLVANLPANYNVTLTVRVKGSVLGNSTITTNFLVTNHNTPITLSDENPSNNTSFMPYTITLPVPVDFTGITARREACNINVQFAAENEINVARYEIEASKDGINYNKIGQLPANRSINYQYLFALSPATEAPVLRIRVKSVDLDGKLQYTPVVTVKANCSGDLAVQLYPNPLPQQKTRLTIEAVSGQMNGATTIVLLDATGRVLRTSMVNLVNAQQFNYDTGVLPAGQYILKLHNINAAEQPVVLRFQKM